MVFQDRTEAGRYLAEKLLHYATCPELLVLGISPGGIPVAGEVARALRAPLEVLLIRPVRDRQAHEPAQVASVRNKLAYHYQEGEGAERGSNTLFSELLIEQEQCPQACTEPCDHDSRSIPDVRGRIVLLIDEGMETGTTMQAAITTLRPYQPARLVIGIPVASALACQKLCTEVDALICLQVPQHFSDIDDWY